LTEGGSTSRNRIQVFVGSSVVPVYDTRNWIDDAGFHDGLHPATPGANRSTDRFGREVLEPEFRGLGTRNVVRAGSP
jgi:hypothetical protein